MRGEKGEERKGRRGEERCGWEIGRGGDERDGKRRDGKREEVPVTYCVVQHKDQRTPSILSQISRQQPPSGLYAYQFDVLLSSFLLSSHLLSRIPFLFYTLIKKERKYIKEGTEARINEVRTSMETKRRRNENKRNENVEEDGDKEIGER